LRRLTSVRRHRQPPSVLSPAVGERTGANLRKSEQIRYSQAASGSRGSSFTKFHSSFTQFSKPFHDFPASPPSTRQVAAVLKSVAAVSLQHGELFLEQIRLSGSCTEFIMSCRLALPVLALPVLALPVLALPASVTALVLSGALHAEPLRPIQAQKVDLDTLTGVAYYTVEHDGYRLVLTLQAPPSDMPFRVVATLAPEQTVTLAVPHKIGEPATELRFIRHNEQIWVSGGDAVAHLEARGD
jgi:hypothetical protein